MGDFAAQTQVGAKVEKFLGIGSAGTATSVVQVQKEGWLHKRPFTGSQKGAWQKRYFVLKDSFLFWYEKKPEGGGFCAWPRRARRCARPTDADCKRSTSRACCPWAAPARSPWARTRRASTRWR